MQKVSYMVKNVHGDAVQKVCQRYLRG
jgi:hypothetical protein